MVSLSVKSKYGLSAMMKLALHVNEGPIQIRTLAESRKIPQNFLEQILVELKREGLVQSTRGARGGYALAKKPAEITVKDVLLCLEGPSELSSGYCGCKVLTQFWTNVEDSIASQFSMSFQDLVEQQQKLDKMLTYSI
jgi:Rrf2 family protein